MPEHNSHAFHATHFLGGGRIHPHRTWAMQMHAHDFHEIIVVLQGAMKITQPNGHAINAQAGEVLLYPAKHPHEERSIPDTPVETIFFSFKGQLNDHIQKNRDVYGRIRFLATSMLEDMYNSTALDHTKALYYLNLIAYELADNELATEGNALAREANGYMEANLHKRVKLADIAQHCHYSPFHFSRIYKAKTGISPISALKQIRLNRAQTLIQSTGLPLKHIAEQSGFANEFHLSREFKRHFNKTTSEYRDSLS